MEEMRPPSPGPAVLRTTISPVRYGFMWSWYPHSPGLSKVKLHSSPVGTGFLGSNPGYSSCVGWSSEAGQWASSPTFSNTTVRPASTVMDLGSNPSSVTCTTTLPPSSLWEYALPAKLSTAAHRRMISRIPTRRSAPLGIRFAMGEGYEIRALLTKTRGRGELPGPCVVELRLSQALSAPWRSPCGSSTYFFAAPLSKSL